MPEPTAPASSTTTGSGPRSSSCEGPRQDGTLIYASSRAQGWGRRLIDTIVATLRARGVTGLHLVASVDNAGALAFYPRVGFAPVPSHEGVQAFALDLSETDRGPFAGA